MTLSNSNIIYHLQQLDPDEFEQFIADLWEQLDWQTEVTVSSRDRGIDVIAERFSPYHQKILIQAKRYQSGNRIGSPQIREYSSLRQQEENIDQVLVVTTSDFTKEARSIARDLNVKCIDGQQLSQLVQENDAIDLLEKRQGIGQSTSLESKPSESKVDEKDSDTPNSILGVGGDIVAEMIGLARVDFSSESEISRQDTDFDGVFAAFNLYTRSLPDSVWLAIESCEEIDFIDRNGVKHNPVTISEKPLRKGWQTHDPEVRTQTGSRNLDVDIRIQEDTQYLAAIDLDSIDDLSRIEIDRYNVEIELDEQDISEVSGLPDEVKTSLKSVSGVSLCPNQDEVS